MLNDPTGPQSAVRAPRLRVVSDNKPLPGVIKASWTDNNYYQTSHFNLSFAASAGPLGWWDVEPPLMIEIDVSLDDGNSWTPMLTGEVDHIQFHIETGLIEMEGRDLSARLVEAKTQESFVNKTSSEVAAILAERHHMQTNITKTTTLVGRYYEADHTDMSLGQFSRTTTEWDLLIYLARYEGFDCFMTGNTLNFIPTPLPSANPYVIQWTPPNSVPRANAITISMERSLTLAKDVQVKVMSWNGRQGRGFTKTARAIGGKAAIATASSGGKPTTTQQYVFVIANLDEATAQKKANEFAHEISLHERVVNVSMPGDVTLTPRNMFKLQGTQTSFDQVYFCASIDRSISFEEGYRQSIRLKNASPRTMTQA